MSYYLLYHINNYTILFVIPSIINLIRCHFTASHGGLGENNQTHADLLEVSKQR